MNQSTEVESSCDGAGALPPTRKQSKIVPEMKKSGIGRKKRTLRVSSHESSTLDPDEEGGRTRRTSRDPKLETEGNPEELALDEPSTSKRPLRKKTFENRKSASTSQRDNNVTDKETDGSRLSRNNSREAILSNLPSTSTGHTHYSESARGKKTEPNGLSEQDPGEVDLNEPSTSSGNTRSLRRRRLDLNSLSLRAGGSQRQICEWQYCGVEMKPGESLDYHYQVSF